MKTLARLALAIALLLLPESSLYAQCLSAQVEIPPKTGASGIRFGQSLDMDLTTLLVGSPLDDEGLGGIEAGSVQALPRGTNGTFLPGWRIAPTTTAGDHFGCSVAVSGTEGLAGAEGDDEGGTDSGAAYLLHRVLVGTKPTWVAGAKLKPPGLAPGARFGAAVAMGGISVIGAPGSKSVYVYDTTGGKWKLLQTVSGTTSGFGTAVATNGVDAFIVGAPGAGKAFLYWKLPPNGPFVATGDLNGAGAPSPEYGRSVAIDLPWIAVGDPGSGDGTVHLFNWQLGWSNGVWHSQVSGPPSPAAPNDFGWSVSLSASSGVGRLTVGDPGAERVHQYQYDPAFPSWTELFQAQSPDPTCAGSCEYGSAVAGSQSIVVGAPGRDRVFWFQSGGGVCSFYCMSGTSANGCYALLAAAGTPSASLASGFVLSAGEIEGDKDGLFFFGTNGKQQKPWGNSSSFQCVVPPVVRGGLLSGSGTAGACDGSLSQDLNALWCGTCPKPQKNPGAGAVVQAQLWYRDPFSTSNQKTSLSHAIEFTVQP